MTHLHTKLSGGAMIAAPLLLLVSTAVYVAEGGGMNSGEAAGAIQVWAMVAFAVAMVALARRLEPEMPRSAAVLSVLCLAGAAGGIGYGIDSIQAALFGGGSIQDTTSGAAPVALQIPGVLFPLSLAALGVLMARTGTAPRWSGLALAAGALLFPMSRIPDVEALAVASDLLLVLALVPLGWATLRRRAPAPAAGARPVAAATGAR